MKNIIALVSLAALLASCGGAPTDGKKVDFTFPATANVVQVMQGDQVQLRVEKDGAESTVLLAPDAEVFYNEKLVEQASILNGQTVYLEGGASDGGPVAKRVIITVWPGREEDKKGPSINIEPRKVPGMISEYLEKGHPKLGISSNIMWQFKKPSVAPPSGRVVDMYTFGEYLMVVSYDQEGEKQFNVLLSKGVEAPATWSGVIREDGKIVEGVYDGP